MTGHRYTRYGSLQNKVVVITGGASGIGADLVVAFRQQESRVHFLDIDMTAVLRWRRSAVPIFTRLMCEILPRCARR